MGLGATELTTQDFKPTLLILSPITALYEPFFPREGAPWCNKYLAPYYSSLPHSPSTFCNTPGLTLLPIKPPRNFPGRPGAKTPCSQHRDLGSVPGRGTGSFMLQIRPDEPNKKQQQNQHLFHPQILHVQGVHFFVRSTQSLPKPHPHLSPSLGPLFFIPILSKAEPLSYFALYPPRAEYNVLSYS